MTQMLQRAFEQASRLPEAEQDAVASWMLEELEDEQRWHKAFAASAGKLSALAAEAREEHRRGQTKKLDPDTL